jgi:cell division protein FtsL
MAVSLPLSLGVVIWQSARYSALKDEVSVLLERQREWIDNNKRLIRDITALSSSARIEDFARSKLMLEKKRPEDVLQVIIGRE